MHTIATDVVDSGTIRPVMVIYCRASLKIKRYCSLNPPNSMKEYADKETCLRVNWEGDLNLSITSVTPR